ncbi:MAG: hypothetical protein ISS45_05960 [Candidatus Omnitrophica bacterium]|nr:hypothetical protein [Candidatus Omnitrophota bacterium]
MNRIGDKEVRKKVKRNKGQIARQETEIRKFCLAWEAIRRREDYVKLYRKFYALDKKKDVLCGEYQLEIYGKFGIFAPIDPSIKANKIPAYRLRMFFRKPAILVKGKIMRRVNTTKNRFVNLAIQIDMEKSWSQICSEFQTFIKSVKKNVEANRRKASLGKIFEKSRNLRHRVHDYHIKDFALYDKFVNYKRKDGTIPFYTVARKQLERKKGQEVDLDRIDSEAKKIKSAYKRAEWLIKGGFRSLM